LFKNPLLAFEEEKKSVNSDQDNEEWSDDDKFEPKETK